MTARHEADEMADRGSHLSDPDRLERLAMYVRDEPPNTSPEEIATALTDAAKRIRSNQALLRRLATAEQERDEAREDADRLAEALDHQLQGFMDEPDLARTSSPRRCPRPAERALMVSAQTDPRCTAHGQDEMYFVLAHPDGGGHCRSCHCICDPDGPTCGHTAGCPGC